MIALSNQINDRFAAIVARVETISRIHNCINLKFALVNGNTVIVDETINFGETVLYFAPGTELMQCYLYYNNLYKNNYKNRSCLSYGLFKNNGLVRTICLRGNYSRGFVMPLTSLSFIATASDLSLLKPGDRFHEINKELICKEYICPFELKSRKANLQTE